MQSYHELLHPLYHHMYTKHTPKRTYIHPLYTPLYTPLYAPLYTYLTYVRQLKGAPSSLRELRIGGPEITGEIPSEVFETNLRKLTCLDLSGCSRTTKSR
jgi:hypothetical protein